MNSDPAVEFLLEQNRRLQEEVYRLRVELAKVNPSLEMLEWIPCEEKVQ